MADKNIQSNIGFLWLLWTLGSLFSYVIGIGLSLMAIDVVGEVFAFVAFGLVVGVIQWLILRKFIQESGWWIIATGLSAPLGLALINFLHRALLGLRGYLVIGSLGFAALGLIIGFAQWGVLRRSLRRAGWWVLASAISWVGGGLIVWAIRLKLVEIFKILAEFALLGIIVGASTGVVLLLLIKKFAFAEDQKTSSITNWVLAGFSLILIVITGARELSGRVPVALEPIPDLSIIPECSQIPSQDCSGDDVYCSEVVFFDPAAGPGYLNYPINGETWDNQYRSYIRRDLQTLIQYASARVACETEQWDYWPLEPVGLGDMSEADGEIPGTSTGNPGHIMGTHEDGNDIDVAYFQKDSKNVRLIQDNFQQGFDGNLLRNMCKYTRFGLDVYHCTEPPLLLDPWRTALFIAYVAENPYTRVIGVDGKIGPVIDDALDHLVQAGWIDMHLRDQIPLAYETINEGQGWFRFHHHHLHVSMYLR